MERIRKATGLLFFRDRAYVSVKKTPCQYLTLFSRKKRLMDRVYKAIGLPFFSKTEPVWGMANPQSGKVNDYNDPMMSQGARSTIL